MRIVFVTCPPDQAAPLLRQLVEESLVAGGNIIAPVRSIYRWKGQICDESETVLLMETSDEAAPAMMKRVRELHPYEVPKILTFEPKEGLADYLQWVEQETAKRI
ncbi:MAG: divalent-cation tolerance protein CutA [Polyangiaceae bacterium]|nr:divalent-cation tolerance protein CutA [Polyangiaceae bacterium]